MHTLCFSFFLFLSVREEDNHCRAEPFQVEIVDNQALIQQVSSHPSSQSLVMTIRYFPHSGCSPSCSETLFLLLISLKAVSLQGQPGIDYSGPKPQSSKPQSQWYKWLGQAVPPPLSGAVYRGTSRLCRQALPKLWGWVKSRFVY